MLAHLTCPLLSDPDPPRGAFRHQPVDDRAIRLLWRIEHIDGDGDVGHVGRPCEGRQRNRQQKQDAHHGGKVDKNSRRKNVAWLEEPRLPAGDAAMADRGTAKEFDS